MPYKLCTRYLHQAHEGTKHSGVERMRELLSNYWWEFKNCNIKSYVDSCDTCANCKGNYGKCTRWPIGHCKRGRRPFELNAQLQRKALHPYHFRQLQSALHGHTMRKRPSNRCCLRSVPILSSPQRDATHGVLWSWHSFYRWSLQIILCPNVHNTGTWLLLAATKLRKYRAAASHDEERPLHAIWG